MTVSLDLIFSALADKTRRAILIMLLEDDMTVTDVAAPFDISLAAISKHLQILTRAGLIKQEAHGRIKWCQIQLDTLRHAQVWLNGLGLFDQTHLDKIEIYLKQQNIKQ